MVYGLAARYRETGEKEYAHKAAVILLRFSEVISKWPFNNWQSGNKTKRTAQSEEAPYYGSFWENGWFYYDLESSAPLVRAYDLVHDSGAMEALGKDTASTSRSLPRARSCSARRTTAAREGPHAPGRPRRRGTTPW